MLKFEDWVCSWRWGLRHPLKFLKYTARWLRYNCIRGRKGWAPCDTWNLDSWFLEVFPEMLDYLAENTHGYPMRCDNVEEWQWEVRQLAAQFRSCREDVLEEKNEYREEYYEKLGKDDELRDKYFAREEELYKARNDELHKAFMKLADIFWELWD